MILLNSLPKCKYLYIIYLTTSFIFCLSSIANEKWPSPQKFFILHMLVLPLIPITALVIQNSVTMNTLLGYQSRVSTIRRQVR